MSRKAWLWGTLGAFAVAGGAATLPLAASATNSSGPAPVVVTNQTSSPVPVTVQGTTSVTGTVSVTNLPTPSPTQNVAGTVSIGNVSAFPTPAATQTVTGAVGISNTPGVIVQNPSPISVSGTVGLTAASSELVVHGALTANGIISVDATRFTYLTLDVWYDNHSNPNAPTMLITESDDQGVFLGEDDLQPTFGLRRVFTAPGTGMTFHIVSSDWTGIEARYAVYGRA